MSHKSIIFGLSRLQIRLIQTINCQARVRASINNEQNSIGRIQRANINKINGLARIQVINLEQKNG